MLESAIRNREMDLQKIDHVHVWRVPQTCADASRVVRVLSKDERQRIASYKFDPLRCRYTFVRGVLRHLLALYTGRPAETLRFVYGPNGKPALETGPHFNISHASGMALIVISHLRVGVDVEQINKYFEWEPIATYFLSAAEREHIQQQPQALRPRSFFRCWTRREALVKACGLGLSAALPGNRDLIRSWGGVWSLRSISPAPGYIGAIAADSEQFVLRSYDWGPKSEDLE